ncbi:chromatin modification-related protein EAF7-domain-containing protein [Kalaharituber pfeilii]|nr:chromatin modification-related protein EAF7-domain-containing protein [Kalaharituber pfeilii]
MPPKKKSRIPAQVDSEAANATTPTSGPSSATTAGNQFVGEPVISDGWTDEQEITLFKAIAVYRWKPAGMHKHFRMLAIEQMMRNHGVSDSHTNAEGIWKKLNTLYNLEGLDEREDMEDESDSPTWTEFKLPEEDFGELMAARRLNPEGTASPGHMMDVSKRRQRLSGSTLGAAESKAGRSPSADRTVGSTVGGSDDDSELRSSPISQRSGPRKRGGRLSMRGVSTPRGGRGGARGGSAKKPGPRKSLVQKEVEETTSEEAAGSSSDEESAEEEEENASSNSSTEAEEESEPESTNAGSTVSTPRGGGRRGGRGGGSAVKSGRGGRRKTLSGDVRRSARKK